MIRIPKTIQPQKRKPLTKDIIEGLTIAWNTPIFFSLFIVLGVVSFCTRPYTQFMPIFAKDILQVGAPGLGLLLMTIGAGAIFGGLTLASVTRFPKAHHLLLLLTSGFGISVILFSASRYFSLSLLFLFLAGAFHTTLLSSITSLLQIHAREETRGRVMSLFGLINRGLGPTGAFPIGAVGTWLGAPLTISLGGLLAIGMAAYMTLGKPHLRHVSMIEEAPLP